jgi:hypothetical protein
MMLSLPAGACLPAIRQIFTVNATLTMRMLAAKRPDMILKVTSTNIMFGIGT